MKGYQVLQGVTVVPGQGRDLIESAAVVLDRSGAVVRIRTGAPSGPFVLMPPAVDVYLDVLAQRQAPRRAAGAPDLASVIRGLDSELVAAGVGTVCCVARFGGTPAPASGLDDAIALCSAIEQLAPQLLCDWRIHAQISALADGAMQSLAAAMLTTNRIQAVSLTDDVAQQDQAAAAVDRKRATAAAAAVVARRRKIAALARRSGMVLATCDDSTAEQIRLASELGATLALFPRTLEAAQAAKRAGMQIGFGALELFAGRATPANGDLTAATAVETGVGDLLCSDGAPGVLVTAPFRLVARGPLSAPEAAAQFTDAPVRALGLPAPVIAEGRPLNAVLYEWLDDLPTVIGFWREGRLLTGRAPLWERVIRSLPEVLAPAI